MAFKYDKSIPMGSYDPVDICPANPKIRLEVFLPKITIYTFAHAHKSCINNIKP